MSGKDRNGLDGGWRQPPSAAERAKLARDTGLPVGLCLDCAHLRILRSGRSRFVRCLLAESAPEYPRYPRLPVLACDGHRDWREG